MLSYTKPVNDQLVDAIEWLKGDMYLIISTLADVQFHSKLDCLSSART